MTEGKDTATKPRSDEPTKGRWALGALALVLGACQGPPSNVDAVDAYYRYDFTSAREALRRGAYAQRDEQVLLNNLRLGMAALADGDLEEAERSLGTSFELLSTAGLNRDRTTAAVLTHEGVRIWKGEPFEQALAYHYVAVLYALLGQYDNVQAAAANSLFRLTDFGADQDAESIVREAARTPGHLERGYRAVDSDFALGFIMQGLGGRLSGLGGWEEKLDAAASMDERLNDLITTLKGGDFDTLLIVDYGQGPRKAAYGPDDALVHFVEIQDGAGELRVHSNDEELGRAVVVCDVNDMAADHRWNNLEDLRRAKSAIGHALMWGGTWVAGQGAYDDSAGSVLAGLGMIGAGLLTRAGARADTRYLELTPAAIFVLPLLLSHRRDLVVTVEGDAMAETRLIDVEPGTGARPRTHYVRLFGDCTPPPPWLAEDDILYSNDHTGVRPGDWPWILGGRDVSTPSRQVLEAYQAGGRLLDLSISDLEALYDAEGILLGSGRERREGQPRNPSYRHILEGGTGLFTPHSPSMGFKRLMTSPHPPYEPKSHPVRTLKERLEHLAGPDLTQTPISQGTPQ
jgi:hypothetical protein